ncbi:hypothetical protein N9A62_02765 [Akkermansiaceae bacterium]|nr:hypothetical protein [Akkermansiaceae bacterium]
MKGALSVLWLCFLLGSCGEEKTVNAETKSEGPNWPRATKWPKFASYEWGATKDEMTQAFAAEGFKWVNSNTAGGKLLGRDAYITPSFYPSGGLNKLSIIFHTDLQGYGDCFQKLNNLLNKKYTAPSQWSRMSAIKRILADKEIFSCAHKLRHEAYFKFESVNGLFEDLKIKKTQNQPPQPTESNTTHPVAHGC